MKRILPKNANVGLSVVVAAAMALTASTGVAQTQETVTIKFDDGDGVTGELVEFSNGLFKIKTVIGQVTIPAEDVFCIGAACPESTRLEIASSPITLTSSDGEATVSGNLIEIADDQYVLATSAGELRVNTGDVTCEGEGCVSHSLGGFVTLNSGAATIEGILVGLAEDAYLVDVEAMGTIRVNIEQFQCSGPGCPN